MRFTPRNTFAYFRRAAHPQRCSEAPALLHPGRGLPGDRFGHAGQRGGLRAASGPPLPRRLERAEAAGVTGGQRRLKGRLFSRRWAEAPPRSRRRPLSPAAARPGEPREAGPGGGGSPGRLRRPLQRRPGAAAGRPPPLPSPSPPPPRRRGGEGPGQTGAAAQLPRPGGDPQPRPAARLGTAQARQEAGSYRRREGDSSGPG